MVLRLGPGVDFEGTEGDHTTWAASVAFDGAGVRGALDGGELSWSGPSLSGETRSSAGEKGWPALLDIFKMPMILVAVEGGRASVSRDKDEGADVDADARATLFRELLECGSPALGISVAVS